MLLVKYIGDAGPFSEVGITGKQQSWRKNNAAYVPDSDAALLLASGQFVVASVDIRDRSEVSNIESMLQSAGWPKRFPGFRQMLLASLVSGATATRSGLSVTIAATSHGIPASTFDGLRFFVPPTASLPAGAMAESLTRVDANTLTCVLPLGTAGSDFAGEAFLSLPFLTAVDVATTTIPANSLRVGSDVEVVVSCGGDTSANQKYWALKFGTSVASYTTATTVPAGRRYGGFSVVGTNKQVGQLIGSSLAAPLVLTKYITADQPITITMQVLAGSAGYAVLYDAFLRVSR